MLLGKSQPIQQTGSTGLNCPGLNGIKLCMQQRNTVSVIFCIGLSQLRFQMAEFPVTVDDILDRWLIQGRSFLIYPGQSPVCRKTDISGITGCFPFRRDKSVDFPQPFFPTRPTFCPGLMVAEALSSSTRVPRRICSEEKTIISAVSSEYVKLSAKVN